MFYFLDKNHFDITLIVNNVVVFLFDGNKVNKIGKNVNRKEMK